MYLGYKYTTVVVIFLNAIAFAVHRAGFGQGTGPVFLTDVRCARTESSLLDCSHRGIGRVYCRHSDDAGVICPPCKSCICFSLMSQWH